MDFIDAVLVWPHVQMKVAQRHGLAAAECLVRAYKFADTNDFHLMFQAQLVRRAQHVCGLPAGRFSLRDDFIECGGAAVGGDS